MRLHKTDVHHAALSRQRRSSIQNSPEVRGTNDYKICCVCSLSDRLEDGDCSQENRQFLRYDRSTVKIEEAGLVVDPISM
jgi:hypothetical protein